MTFRKRPEERDTLGNMSKPIEASIVVVDDEPSIRELLVASLHFAGFEVNTAASGSEAIEVIEKVQPDLIVLDVMLPDIDGFTVTRRIRQEGINAPVLFLTARDDTQDKIMGLTVGGDDYVTKPFSLEEVVARIRAILRRTREQVEDDPIIRVADLEINEDSHDVTRAGQPVDLSPTEYKLLRYLMDNEGRVLSKAQILDHVWQYDWGGDAAIVESYISYLRKKVDGIEVETIDGKLSIGRGENQKDTRRQLARHVDAVDTAHLDVEEDKVGACVLHPLQAFYGVGIGSQFDVAAPLAELADNAESYRLVVYGNALHGCRISSCMLTI